MSATLDLRQRMTALGRANEIRIGRAEIKARLHAEGRCQGAYSAAGLLERGVWLLASVDVGEYVQWVPRFGKCEAKKLLGGLKISPWREVGELSSRERSVIADALRAFGDGRPRVCGMVLRSVGVIDAAILAFLGDQPELAFDIADAVGVNPRSMGGRLAGLEREGLVERVVLARNMFGWVVTESGRMTTA